MKSSYLEACNSYLADDTLLVVLGSVVPVHTMSIVARHCHILQCHLFLTSRFRLLFFRLQMFRSYFRSHKSPQSRRHTASVGNDVAKHLSLAGRHRCPAPVQFLMSSLLFNIEIYYCPLNADIFFATIQSTVNLRNQESSKPPTEPSASPGGAPRACSNTLSQSFSGCSRNPWTSM